MALAVSKTQREQAKREDKVIIQVEIDAHYLSEATREKFRGKFFGGKFQLTGAMPPEAAQQLWELCLRWRKKKQF